MSYEALKTVELEYNQALYLACNCTQENLESFLRDDFKPEDIPALKFKKFSASYDAPTIGVRWTGDNLGYNTSGSHEYENLILNENIMKHSFDGSLTDVEEYVAVYSTYASTVDVTVGRVIEDRRFVLLVPANFLTIGNYYIYAKKSDNSFIRLYGNWSRYSDGTQRITTRQREVGTQIWGDTSTVEYVNDNKLVPLYQGQTTGQLLWKSTSQIITNFRIAKDEYAAKNYLVYGDESGLIDEGTQDTTPKNLYEELYFRQEYWYGFIPDTTDINSHHVDVWYSDPYTPHEADMDADFYARYKFNLQDKPNLALYIGTPSSPPDTHASQFFGARLQLYFLERDGVVYDDSDSKPVFIWNMGAGGRFSNMSSIIQGYTPIGIAPNYVISLAEAHGSTEYDLFGANLETNIPIFRTRELAQAYLDGEIGADQAINSIGPIIGANGNRTGHELTSNSYNDIDAAAVCSECLCCTSGAFQEFFDKLFDADNRESILAGLELYGTDTASFIVDTFAVPFDYTVFQDTEAINTLSFGSYHRTFDSTFNRTTKLNPKIVPAFSCSIVGGFNDWRDWQSEYYLALPYVGRNIHINKEVYLYKLLECDVSVDIRTGQIKYFLKCNGVVTDTFEGVCRISMPIQTTNNYSFAREKLGAAASVVTGIIGGAANIATGNIGGAIGNAIGVAESTLDLEKNKPINTTGNCSPANAWNDPLECYLIVQTPEYEYSTNIKNTYGLPANYVGTVGGQSGYVECENVFLKTGATEQEQSEILTLLSNGVII